MAQTKLVVLNGPPNCGKDAAGTYLEKYMHGTVNLVSFKKPIFDIVLSLFPITEEEFFSLYNDRKGKESPSNFLRITLPEYVRLCRVMNRDAGLTNGFAPLPNTVPISPRDAMIYASECIAKPLFGGEVFGERLLSQLKEGVINVATDGGFQEEVSPSIRKLGEDHVHIVRIYRPDHDYAGDSRGYLSFDYTALNAEVFNTSTLDVFYQDILNTVTGFQGV